MSQEEPEHPELDEEDLSQDEPEQLEDSDDLSQLEPEQLLLDELELDDCLQLSP